MENIKIKLLYLLLIAILCAGAYLVGLNAHRPKAAETIERKTQISNEPDFDSREPFISLTYNDCPQTNVPDEQNCVVDLAENTIVEADKLADKLIALGSKRIEQLDSGVKPMQDWEYGDLVGMADSIRAAQEARDNYFDSVCGLDVTKIYGGTGMGIEFNACRYYYGKQYLKILEGIDKGIAQ
ncbi:MAG TPA: hypothetical protein PLA19_04205 [Candidatus Pacearchaeota archaeon]|nr:hypothetical protein [Candidatus Pacearchaeota archaeon]